MSRQIRDPNLDTLLDLDGQILVNDPTGKHWVKFEVRSVEPSEDRPHGLDYSLTLHGKDGERLAGFDNAHAVKAGSGPGAKRRTEKDHKHRFRTIKPYDYEDAGKLMEDFWNEVDKVLKERGVNL